jgi:hypothetical protein
MARTDPLGSTEQWDSCRTTRQNVRVPGDQTERVGVDAVRLAFSRLGWFPREAERPDYGVDLFVETATDDRRPSGRLLGVQVKSGSSYIGGSGDGVVRPDQAHIGYWQGYSLPVIIAVYDPDTEVVCWQVVSEETIDSTGQGWKIVVPADQVLDEGAQAQLALLVSAQPQPDKAETALSRLRADLTWMQVLDEGGSVGLEADEWVNKTSGRGDLRLIARPAGDGDAIEGQFTVFLGLREYAEALPELFPWADLHLDEDAAEEADHDQWMAETGIWDSEEKAIIGNSEDFAEWRASRFPTSELRPYSDWAGEVAHWRLILTLNDLGRAVLALERHLTTS